MLLVVMLCLAHKIQDRLLKRRFHLIAGLLELADREFSSLTDELERYGSEVQAQADAGNLEIELNSTSAIEFLKVAISRHNGKPRIAAGKLSQLVIAELRRFGIDTVSKFAILLSDEFLNAAAHLETTAIGLVRDAMIYADIDKYFDTAWRQAWQGWDRPSIHLAEKKYGQERVQEIVAQNSIDVLDDFDNNSYDDTD